MSHLLRGIATLKNHCSRSGTALSPHHRRRSHSAFMMIEVLFAIFILVIMALMFGAVSVSATRASRFSNSYNQAMSIAQHKIDEFQNKGYTNSSNPSALYADNVLDDPSVNYGPGNEPAPTISPGLPATGSYKGYFTNVDNLSQYFVAKKDAAGKLTTDSVHGEVLIKPYNASTLQVTITIKWQDNGYAQSSYTTQAIITKESSI